jgi:hypothetical protein
MTTQAINYQCVLADLRARRERLNQAIEAIEQLVGETESGRDSAREHAQRQPIATNIAPQVPRQDYSTSTIGDAAAHFIKLAGKPQKIRTIANGLIRGGIKSNSKNLYTTLYNVLTDRAKRENTDLVKIGSQWGLLQWQQDSELRGQQ